MAIPPIALVTRKHIQVQGVVQGVGFRPFIYKLAKSLGLAGYVFNSSSGVTIEIEGSELAVQDFCSTLKRDAPPLAEITGISILEAESLSETGFFILQSRDDLGSRAAGEYALVSPDAGTCVACWQDFGDSLNRRYGYPFTNCTHCGPRYTIVCDVPYDRAATTMSEFTMCDACTAEYEDPEDRRFHAQPNACSVCGPSLALAPRGSSLADLSFTQRDSLPSIHQARSLLLQGKILAVKGLGGFLLACDARNDFAVAELRKRKRRPAKPFAIMVRDVAAARMFAEISPEDEAALLSVRRPIVILPLLNAENLSRAIAPGNSTVGVMLPYTPLHYLLFGDSPENISEIPALVMTSGNLSEEPIVIANSEALLQLDGVADWFLLHNREIATRVDDSVVRTFEKRERVLRRSRGFAPQGINLEIEMEEVLAFGAEQKNTFCMTKGRFAILSQHIGDLENYETKLFFEETVAKMQHIFKVVPQAVAYDLHPGYMSTRMALASAIEKKIGVQHHHAHIASCMAENHLQGKVLGVALDGTGFGTDGKIWGGEFLVADFAGFDRQAHFRNVLLPGGDAAVKQPWRMALSYLRDTFGGQLPADLEDFPCFREISTKQFHLVDRMIAGCVQTVETSSCGRLFDAVAALLGLASEVTLEGQAAIALEMRVQPAVEDQYEFVIDAGQPQAAQPTLQPKPQPEPTPPAVVDFRPTIAAIVNDLRAGRSVAEISACFHNTLSAAIVEVCCRIRSSDAVDRVCISGGVAQNLYLLDRTVVELRRRGFQVFLHALVPANDGGISLGQAVIANELLKF